MFKRFIGIDYSGAKFASSPLPTLRVYESKVGELRKTATEVRLCTTSQKHWSRYHIAKWLLNELSDRFEATTLVAIDHGFSFPLSYFDKYQLPLDWQNFLDDFSHHWPTDESCTSVKSIRTSMQDSEEGLRVGHSKWRRLCERRVGAKSVFHFDVPGSVATSTHAGIPWLRYLRKNLSNQLHFWPFDGWNPPEGKHVITEAYPALWKNNFPKDTRTQDQHDAFSLATNLLLLADNLELSGLFNPGLSPSERICAEIEGWIFGVT
jgi:hypothetical protein